MVNDSTPSYTGVDKPAGGACILVLDKDVATRQKLHELLTDAGYDTVGVGDAITARASCRDSKPALVLMETHPADDSDFGLMRWLLSEHQVPVVLMDDTDNPKKAHQAARYGGYGYLLKPFAATQLIATVEIALLSHRQWLELHQRDKEINHILNTNRQISTAVGILMERHRLGDTESFEYLRSTARSRQRKLEELAREVVAATRELNLSSVDNPGQRAARLKRGNRTSDEGTVE